MKTNRFMGLLTLLGIVGGGILAHAQEPIHVSAAVAQKLETHREGGCDNSAVHRFNLRSDWVAEFTVKPDGTVADVKVLSSKGPKTRNPLDSIDKWTYKPYMANGTPTAVRITVDVKCSVDVDGFMKITYLDK
jgi:hypothetical protein